MVESLPTQVKVVRGLPVYYDETQGIWFVNGYPDNFPDEASATAYAESLVPTQGGVTPPSGLPNWAPAAAGFGLIAALLLV